MRSKHRREIGMRSARDLHEIVTGLARDRHWIGTRSALDWHEIGTRSARGRVLERRGSPGHAKLNCAAASRALASSGRACSAEATQPPRIAPSWHGCMYRGEHGSVARPLQPPCSALRAAAGVHADPRAGVQPDCLPTAFSYTHRLVVYTTELTLKREYLHSLRRGTYETPAPCVCPPG